MAKLKPRLFLVQLNLVLVLILITYLRYFTNDEDALWSVYVWYIWLTNSILNFFLLHNKDPFSPQHIFPTAYVLLLTTQDIFALPYLNYPNQNTYYLIISGLVMFLLGVMHGDTPSSNKPGALRGLIILRQHNYRILLAAICLITLLGIVGFAAQAQLPIFSADVENYRFNVRERMLLFGPIWYFCLTATLVFVWGMFASIMTEDKVIKIIYGTTAMLAIMSLLLWGIRGRIVDSVLILLILYHYSVKRVSLLVLVSIGIFGLSLIAVAGIARLETAGSTFQGDPLFRAVHELQINTSNLQLLVETYPEKINYGYGLNTLYPFYTLLPGHQPGLAEQLKEALNLEYEGGGFTATILGEFYMDFGPFGVILGMLFFGKIIGMIYRKVGLSKVATLLYPFLIVASVEFIRNGGIINFLFAYFIVLSILLFRYGVEDIKSEYGYVLGKRHG